MEAEIIKKPFFTIKTRCLDMFESVFRLLKPTDILSLLFLLFYSL